jgi:hypothetical protein
VHLAKFLTGLVAAARWAIPWASVLLISGVLAYGSTVAITGCCSGDSRLTRGTGTPALTELSPAEAMIFRSMACGTAETIDVCTPGDGRLALRVPGSVERKRHS